jgi:hypothetical protein
MDHVGRQLQLRDVLLVVDDPGHLGRIEAELVDQHLARPHAGRHRVGAHADLLAFEILRGLDPGIRAYQQAAMVKAAHDEDRQRDERRAIGTGDDVSGRRQFADVEFDVAHHAAEGADLRLDGDELGVHAFDGNGSVADGRRVRVFSDGDLEVDFFGQLPLQVSAGVGASALTPRRQLNEGSSAGRVVSMG